MEMLAPYIPLFQKAELLNESNYCVDMHIAHITVNHVDDAGLVFELAIDWLNEQVNSPNNYKNYRAEVTTFLNWCFSIEGISVSEVTRRFLSRYMDFCDSPPESLIARYNVPQFVDANGELVPNPNWRPFVRRPHKKNASKKDNSLTIVAQKTKLAILSTFFVYLNGEEYCDRNPVPALLRHGRFRETNQADVAGEDYDNLKAFSELQWSYVVSALDLLVKHEPGFHERTRFLILMMYSCYLRISEVAAHKGFVPLMSHFQRDRKTGVWGYLIPKSKGGKKRTVAVSDALLDALIRYRRTRCLPDLPTFNEIEPLFERFSAPGHGRDAGIVKSNIGIKQIGDLIETVFSLAAELAEKDGLTIDAYEIRQMTPHSLRHTGITHDINLRKRPLSHVQADAGHDSLATTSKYLHTSRTERHETAKRKSFVHLTSQ